jgi:hypothetical protein
VPISPAIRAAEWVLGAGFVYATLGSVFAVTFAVAGVRRALNFAGPVSLGARLLFLPGAMALWPLVLWRWVKAR